MRTWHTTLAAGVLGTLVAVAVPGQAQQVTMGTRFHTLSDSFYENSSINWSGTYLWPINNTKNTQFSNVFPGVTFSFGAPNLAKPQFGSPDPSAGLSTNFAILNKNTQIAFGINYGQGYKQSAITQVPSVTFMNGQTGYVSDTSQTPFVISVVPVVGASPSRHSHSFRRIPSIPAASTRGSRRCFRPMPTRKPRPKAEDRCRHRSGIRR